MARKRLIAIVDDDPSVREGLVDLIIAMGFKAEAFKSAENFLSSPCLARTACLIADVRMPGMNGLELLEQLIASGKTIPTILITAFTQEIDRTRALNSGAICYLSKPFDRHEFMECVRAALSSSNPQRTT